MAQNLPGTALWITQKYTFSHCLPL
ncbi:hypothetical protein BGLA2_480005 [Burkholderia gladioli]|nr:hypothetical protein BGLA2_480005 [Burkholderia gladioli]